MTTLAVAGRDLDLVLDLAAIADLRQNAGFDFNEMARSNEAYREFLIGSDEKPLLIACWHLVRSSGLSLADFAKAIDLDSLRRAFGREVQEFLPEHGEDGEKKGRSQPDDFKGLWVERLGWQLAGICGVDGRRLTLRQLAWMAREKKRSTGELAAWHVTQIVSRIPFGGAVALDPEKINPYRVERPKSAAMIALEQWKAEQAWKFRVKPND